MAQKCGRRYDVSQLSENQYSPGSRGLDRNYKPMEEIFELVLNRTSSGA